MTHTLEITDDEARCVSDGPNDGRALVGRGGDSAGKRRMNEQRNDKKAAKDRRRQERLSGSPVDTVDEAGLMEQFQILNELRAAGGISDAEFEVERHHIFVALGLEDSLPEDGAPERPSDRDPRTEPRA
jgi:hypothetical protein